MLDGREIFSRAVKKWPAKVLSLGLAVFLFVFHRMSSLEERFFFTPLNIEVNSGLVPSSPYPRMIRLSLRGEASSINPIMDDDIEAYIDMRQFDVPGVYVVPVKWRKKGTAQGVEPLEISADPMEVTLSLDHKISKFVSITPSLRGQVETGYALSAYSLDPSQVIIDGPAELLGGISEMTTELIDLDSRIADFSINVAILQRDPLLVIRGNGTTEFSGTVRKIIPVRNIPNVPIAVTGLLPGFSGELGTRFGNIHLEAENQDAVNSFEPPPDFLKVDCSGISGPGTYILRVIAGTAENINVMVEPSQVTVRITNAEEP